MDVHLLAEGDDIARKMDLEALRTRMHLIATFPLHVNAAYRDRPGKSAPVDLG